MVSIYLPIFTPSFVSEYYYRLAGASVGKRTQINTQFLNDAYMVSIGDDTIVGSQVFINAHMVEGGKLILKRVTIGKRCTIGAGALINPGVQVHDDAIVAARAVVPKNTVIPKGEIWGGVPAKCPFG